MRSQRSPITSPIKTPGNRQKGIPLSLRVCFRDGC
nr:MAG TPA: hypothetical protein [Caudoviricetes sp.]